MTDAVAYVLPARAGAGTVPVSSKRAAGCPGQFGGDRCAARGSAGNGPPPVAE